MYAGKDGSTSEVTSMLVRLNSVLSQAVATVHHMDSVTTIFQRPKDVQKMPVPMDARANAPESRSQLMTELDLLVHTAEELVCQIQELSNRIQA